MAKSAPASASIQPGVRRLIRFGVEAAKGQEFSNDPNAMRWLRYGITLGSPLDAHAGRIVGTNYSRLTEFSSLSTN